jgi:hypothetical protein
MCGDWSEDVDGGAVIWLHILFIRGTVGVYFLKNTVGAPFVSALETSWYV